MTKPFSRIFVEEAIRTESRDFDTISNRVIYQGTIRLLHAGLGMVTESGEFVDQLKKHIFYGKPLDHVNLKEEIGDLFWYLAVACDELDISFDEVQELVIKKLRKRYSNNFDAGQAIHRDIEKELSHYQPLGTKEEAGEGIKPEVEAGSVFRNEVDSGC